MGLKPKIVKLAPYIYNRNNFYFRDHPVLHPSTTAYDAYWEAELKKIIEGFWGLDQAGKTNNDDYDPNLPGGYRYITPQQYWYVNYTFIQHLPNQDSPPITQMPDLRDIDWYWFAVVFTAMGFSGFTDDEDYSCHYLLERYHKHLQPNSNITFDLTPKEKKLWATIKPNILKKDGTYKSYKNPIDYLLQTFDSPKGLPLYQNPMKNVSDLEARGGGKTYRMMGLLSHTYNTFGAKTVDDYWNMKKGPTLCVGSIDSGKSASLLAKFEFSQNMLIDNFGAWVDDENFIPGYFHKEHSGVLSVGNEKNQYRHVYKAKKGNIWKKYGTWTSILHRTYENNPEAFVGNRSILMLEDEFGLNYHATKCAHADNTVMKMSGVKMGIAVKSGTGGNITKIQQAKEIFYHPDDYDYIRLEDFYEGSVTGIGMFIPAYYVDSSFRDENGNQDVEAAFEQEMHNRKKLLEGDSLTMLDGYIIDHPLVPSEMFLTPDTNIFPVVLIREHRANLEIKGIVNKICRFGELEYTDKTETSVKFIEVYDKYRKPILDYDLKHLEGNIKGLINIIEPPVDNIPNPTYSKSLYKVVYDPVKDDKYGTSLAAILVYKGYTLGDWNPGIQNNIVATYYGREDDNDLVHETCIQLAIYYNAKILAETNIPDFIRYCKKRKKLHLLQPTPWDSISSVIANPGRKYDFGINMSSSRLKIQGEQLLNKWLKEKRGEDEFGKDILNLHHCMDLRLLDELLVYDRTKNTDGVSAMFLLMLWLNQEELVPYESNRKENQKSKIEEYFNKLIAEENQIHLEELYYNI